MRDVQKLRDLLDRRDSMLAEIGGCGNGGCIVSKPKGMHTNGGCRCDSDRMRMLRYAYANNRFADGLRALISQAESSTRDGLTRAEAHKMEGGSGLSSGASQAEGEGA